MFFKVRLSQFKFGFVGVCIGVGIDVNISLWVRFFHVSCSKFVLYVDNNQFPNNFNNDRKNRRFSSQNGCYISFCGVNFANSIMMAGYCRVCSCDLLIFMNSLPALVLPNCLFACITRVNYRKLSSI